MAENNDPNQPRFRTFRGLTRTNTKLLGKSHAKMPDSARYAANVGSQSADIQQFAQQRRAWERGASNIGDVNDGIEQRHNQGGAGYLNVPTQIKCVQLFVKLQAANAPPILLIPKNINRMFLSITNFQAGVNANPISYSFGPMLLVDGAVYVGQILGSNLTMIFDNNTVPIDDVYVQCGAGVPDQLVFAQEGTLAPEANAI